MNSTPFNKVYLTGQETEYIQQVFNSGKFSGGVDFTKKGIEFLSARYSFNEALLTTSCTAALEMAAMLINIQPGDEVILPSYTFVSTANAFALRGAKIVFIDSCKDNPNMDAELLEGLITEKTKAIVPVHYAGIACDMDVIMNLARKHNLFVIEDAAHSINSFYKNKALGSFGNLGAISFHETKNITCGEGGMLIISDKQFSERASVIIDKGTNRKAFFEGKTDKYEWVGKGSSYRLPEISAAFLFAQLEALESIQNKRMQVWQTYYRGLKALEDSGLLRLPLIPQFAEHNASIFYIICKNKGQRNLLLNGLQKAGINASFHYQPLHYSPYVISLSGKKIKLPNAERYGECLLRLPLFSEISDKTVEYIIEITNKIVRGNY